MRANIGVSSEFNGVDAIQAITYGMNGDRLALGTRTGLSVALNVAKMRPECPIVFATSHLCRRDRLEFDIKLASIPKGRAIYAGSVKSTMQEVRFCHEELAIWLGREPRRIVVVTGEVHSERLLLVWGQMYPRVAVQVVGFRPEFEVEPNHPVVALRSEESWRKNAIRAELMLKIFGARFLERLDVHQKVG